MSTLMMMMIKLQEKNIKKDSNKSSKSPNTKNEFLHNPVISYTGGFMKRSVSELNKLNKTTGKKDFDYALRLHPQKPQYS